VMWTCRTEETIISTNSIQRFVLVLFSEGDGYTERIWS
jgi:hypothetical protein